MLLYCDQDDLARMLSSYAVEAFSDHDEAGAIDADVVADCIAQATEEINRFAMQRYSDSGLAASSLVNRWATALACYFLCQRRGNSPPDSLQKEFERVTGALEKVATGAVGGYLGDVPLREDFRPTSSNLQIDRRDPYRVVRVVQDTSTDAPTTLRQDGVY